MGQNQNDGSTHHGDVSVRHEPTADRFAVRLGDTIAYLTYEEKQGRALDYTQVYVPPEYRHQGIGGKITKAALEYARDNGLKVIPSCSYVDWYLKHHPEYRDLTTE
jgi:hypothetical protein